MTNILALDASTEHCSTALLQGDQLLERGSDQPRSHADRLLPMVEELLAEAGLNLQQLDAIAFGAGPGSFTGLRICLGVVQGLAFGAGLPVAGISSLEAMACTLQRQQPGARWVIPAIDARMGEVYWAAYALSGDSPEQLVAPEVATVADVDRRIQSLLPGKAAVGVGTGWPLLPDSRRLLSRCEESFWPQASSIALLGKRVFEAGRCVDVMSAEPVYLRTEISWKKRERIRR